MLYCLCGLYIYIYKCILFEENFLLSIDFADDLALSYTLKQKFECKSKKKLLNHIITHLFDMLVIFCNLKGVKIKTGRNIFT